MAFQSAEFNYIELKKSYSLQASALHISSEYMTLHYDKYSASSLVFINLNNIRYKNMDNFLNKMVL